MLSKVLLRYSLLTSCLAAVHCFSAEHDEKLQNNLNILLNYLHEGSPGAKQNSGANQYEGKTSSASAHHKRGEFDNDTSEFVVEPVVVAPPLSHHKLASVTRARLLASDANNDQTRTDSWLQEEPTPVDLPHNRALPTKHMRMDENIASFNGTQESKKQSFTRGLKFSKVKPHASTDTPTEAGAGGAETAANGGGEGVTGETAMNAERREKGKSKRKSKGGSTTEGGKTKKNSGDAQPKQEIHIADNIKEAAKEKASLTVSPTTTPAPQLPPPASTAIAATMVPIPPPTAAPAQNYKLIYFDARGICEPIRLLFHYAKVPFEDARISRKQWLALKDSTVYGKVPILEVDGKPLTYCHTISRYLARTFGLAGTTNWEQAKVDEISDFHSDVAMDLQPYLYVVAGFHQGDREALRKAIFLPAVEKHFPVYVNILKQSGSGFFVSSGLTWIDFVISEYMTTIKHFEPAILDKYPTITKFVRKVQSLPQIFDYIANREHQPV